MRTKLAAITVVLALLGMRGTAQALTTSLVWQSTGTSELPATATGNQTLDLFLNLDADDSITGYQLSVDLDGATFVSGFCDSPAAFAIDCPAAQPVDGTPVAGNAGLAGFWSGAAFFTQVDGPVSLNLGTLTVTDLAPGMFLTLGIFAAQDIITDPDGNPLSLDIVPEPSTALLLAGGLAGLGVRRRRC